MSPELAKIIRAAIRSWPATIRFCLIVVVIAATTLVPFYLVKTGVLPIILR